MKNKHDLDIEFLALRQLKAGWYSPSPDRDTGTSSNSIVAIAYGVKDLSEQEMPSDMSDLMACERMWDKLPNHRKTKDALKAMDAARMHIKNKYGY